LSCPGDGGEEAVLAAAVALSTDPLPDGRSPWAATLLTGLRGGAD